MRIHSRILLALSLVVLAACGSARDQAAPELVTRAAFSDASPPSITLDTVINTRTGAGGHSALMVNGSQRVVFDPAGSWFHRTAPMRGDVIYGFTPSHEELYVDYHARETHYVVMHNLPVSAEQAERLLQIVMANGRVGNAMCAQAVSGVLIQGGFSGISRTWYPVQLMDQFKQFPGVTERKYFDDSPADNRRLLLTQQALLIEN